MAEAAQSDPFELTSRPTGRRLSQYSRYLVLLVPVLLAAVGWWIQSTVASAIRQDVEKELKSILQTEVAALRLWMDGKCAAARQIAEDQDVKRLSAELIALSRESMAWRETVLSSETLKRWRSQLAPISSIQQFQSYSLIRPDGAVVASLLDDLVGRQLSDLNGDLLQQIQEGRTALSRPFLAPVLITGNRAEPTRLEPAIVVVTPLRDTQGQLYAYLRFRLRPYEDFTRILAVARPGETGETYAFDEQGLFISESRFVGQLKNVGLLLDRNDAITALNLHVRDPGVNLMAGERPTVSRDLQPLTAMARAAVTAWQPGHDVEGYRNYRGVDVVGAWTWLPEHRFAIATEMEKEEAFRPLAVLRRAFYLLFGLLVVSALGMAIASHLALRLRRRAQRAMIQARQFGQYTLEERIGGGGMGEVYRARHALLRRSTALKLLVPNGSNDEDIARFEREVQLTSHLTHPNTIAIYDYGRTPDGIFYYVMEYLEGLDLDALVKICGPVPEERAIHILRQVCGSLAEAHQHHLVHRDIKPANLMLCERGAQYDVVKVLDFGLVKNFQKAARASVTSADMVAGTPGYLAPETLKSGVRVDPRSDLYAVGAVGYFLVTGGQLPFESSDLFSYVAKHLNEKPERPSLRIGFPIAEDLEALILRCLETDPGDRPQSAEELSNALGACRHAGRWAQANAKSWWTAHSSEIRRGTPKPVLAQSITVDFAHWRAGKS